MASLTKTQWIDAAMEVLSEHGSNDLSIVKLSNKLGVTRGSFYYHFKSLNELIDCMIATWEDRVVNRGFEITLTNHNHPEQEFRNLIDYVTQLTDRYDLVFRQWASTNAHVKSHMERLDQKRLTKLVEVFQRLSGDKKEGAKLARIAFFAYIGSLHTFPHLNSEEQKKAANELFDLLLSYLNLTTTQQ